MDGIVITWPQLLYISMALLLFYVAELLLFLRKSSLSKTRSEQVEPKLDSASDEIAALRREIENLKVRVASLQVQQVQVDSSPQGLFGAEPQSQKDMSPYSQAIRMAQSGADADAVAAGCGISRGEADLIVALYKSASKN